MPEPMPCCSALGGYCDRCDLLVSLVGTGGAGHRNVLGDQAVEACLFSQFHHCGEPAMRESGSGHQTLSICCSRVSLRVLLLFKRTMVSTALLSLAAGVFAR